MISDLNFEPTPKSQINWILSGVEGCKHVIIRTLRLRYFATYKEIPNTRNTLSA